MNKNIHKKKDDCKSQMAGRAFEINIPLAKADAVAYKQSWRHWLRGLTADFKASPGASAIESTGFPPARE